MHCQPPVLKAVSRKMPPSVEVADWWTVGLMVTLWWFYGGFMVVVKDHESFWARRSLNNLQISFSRIQCHPPNPPPISRLIHRAMMTFQHVPTCSTNLGKGQYQLTPTKKAWWISKHACHELAASSVVQDTRVLTHFRFTWFYGH